MTAAQFASVVALARTGRDFSLVDDSILHGCGLPDYRRVTTTAEAAAKFVLYHAMQFNGEWCARSLNECAEIFRRKVLLA